MDIITQTPVACMQSNSPSVNATFGKLLKEKFDIWEVEGHLEVCADLRQGMAYVTMSLQCECLRK